MKIRSASFTRPFGLLVLCLFAASSATAAPATRTWVSGVGDDLNPCTRTAPCKTFAGALTKTALDGEIDALDSGEFGPADITQGVTIDGGAGMAKILAPRHAMSVAAVIVEAGSNDIVTLRHLTVKGQGVNHFDLSRGGIVIAGGRNVLIENCVVYGFPVVGIGFYPLGAMDLLVRDTTIEANDAGIIVQTDGPFFARMTAIRVRMDGNHDGLAILNNALVFVRNSSASNNQRNGFEAVAQFGATSQLDLENVSSSNNGNAGVLAEGSGAVIRLSNTTIDHNGGAGVVPLSGGLILSFGNNKFSANAAGDGTINGPAVPK